MGEFKVGEHHETVEQYIAKLEDEAKKKNAYQLLKIFESASGYEAKMWGPSIIGFGRYHYQINKQIEGDAPLVAFGLKKNKISLYIAPGFPEREQFLKILGKHTIGKTCVYINDVKDIDEGILEKLIKETILYLKMEYKTEKETDA